MSEGGLAQLSGVIGVSIRSSVSFLLVERLVYLARQVSRLHHLNYYTPSHRDIEVAKLHVF